jgi:SAM-dependent methyltransferase
MSPSPTQVLIRERHGSFSRLSCYMEGAPHTWDSEWNRYSPAGIREVMEYYRTVTPILPLLLRHLPRDGEVLEAGSGLGFWVALLNEAGCRARGIDCSEQALAQARSAFPGLRFDYADVRALPFPGGSLAGYVSFGVAEHFVEGPDAVLLEAARVLRPGGIMILTVPWISPLRRLQPALDGAPPSEGTFYQYFFEREEMERRAQASGFRIVTTTSYGTTKTVFDFLRQFSGAGVKRKRKEHPPSPAATPDKRGGAEASGVDPAPRARPVGVARRLFWRSQNLVLENPLARRLAGHMLMLVAKRTAEETVSRE